MSSNKGASLSELVEVMDRLLAPDGCPWDREQSLESLRPYLLEECFELVDAIDQGDDDNHREELGDLLFQIVFQSALQERAGRFQIDDVVRGIATKLQRRHPHVFGDATADTAAEVLNRWERIKKEEKAAKGEERSHLAGVPRALPGLSRAQKLSSKASRVGFDWPDAPSCLAKVREEVDEVAEAMEADPDSPESRARIAEELGDLLFATTALARKLGIDADMALSRANDKFTERFTRMEEKLAQAGTRLEDSNLEEMDAVWNQVKEEQP